MSLAALAETRLSFLCLAARAETRLSFLSHLLTRAWVDCSLQIQKFCWGIDTKIPLLASFPDFMGEVFTEDMQFGLSREPARNSADIKLMPMGLAGFSAFIDKVQGKYVGTHHHCTNTEITFGAAGTAFAKTYATNYHLKKDGTRYDYFGVYEDEVRAEPRSQHGTAAARSLPICRPLVSRRLQLVKTDKGWRIKARKQFPIFTQGETAPDPK